jgi:DNA polymerase I-like protein with 3'-5' exonuclease and polymerase domains
MLIHTASKTAPVASSIASPNFPFYKQVRITGHPDWHNIRALDESCVPMIRRMHRAGIAINIERLNDLSADLRRQEEGYRRDICEYVPNEQLQSFTSETNNIELQASEDEVNGVTQKRDKRSGEIVSADINLNSGEQVADLLYKHLGIGRGQKLKMTKAGDRVSTDKKQLESLKNSKGEPLHPVVGLILRYREVVKLRTTYTEKMPLIARYDPKTNTYRIHTQFVTTRTSTGRLACVAGDTPLTTNRGTFTFAEYLPQSGDMVFTHQHRWQPVIRKFYKGIDKMYRVCLNTGESIKCTADHRFFTPSYGWKRLGDLRPGDKVYVSIDKLHKEQGKYKISNRDLPIWREPNNYRDCREDRYNDAQCALYTPAQLTLGCAEERTSNPLLYKQIWDQEPYVWEVRGTTPKLEGGCGRSKGLLYSETEWQERIQAQACHGSNDRDTDSPDRQIGQLTCTSYRRKSKKQRPRQLGPINSTRSQEITRTAERIREIIPVGAEGVWDIEVAGDSSYVSCGFYNHNSRAPNIQNLPFRTELGRLIRECFIPSPGCVFVGADFSQVELRILAHCSNDPTMLEIYRNNGDIHVATAMAAFNKTKEEVKTPEGKLKYRLPSKVLNFATVYGLAKDGLQQQLAMQGLNWTIEECQAFIDRWFDLYPGVKALLDLYYSRARRYGLVWDLFGRTRLVPEVASTHSWIRNAGLRQAGNMPIQAFSAGLTKLAMAVLEEDNVEYRRMGYYVEPLLQIHDELIQETQADFAEIIADNMTDRMSNLTKINNLSLLRVPILGDAQIMPDCWKKGA